MERTFCMIKPDGVQRRLVGRILQRFEEKGLRIAGLKLLRVDRATAENLYSVLAMVLEGAYTIEVVRTLLGATFGYQAAPGTIRGDYGSSKGFNLIHASDSKESAAREIPIFFKPEELAAWTHADHAWVYEEPERI
jgi:nucleoside-diphosphate kinase